MALFDALKIIHVSCAVLSVSGFTLRGYWMLTENKLLQLRLVKVLPHTIDTLLLASALGMVYLWGVSPFAVPWLGAKIVALLAYIGLGMVAMRFGHSKKARGVAYSLALITAAYIVCVAFSKSALGPLALLS